MRERFRWIVGIENAFIPDMDVDELTWTRHRTRVHSDIALAREAGADAIRYGVTWPEVETAPGSYDWRTVDEALRACEAASIEPIWDLVHFGVPAHIEGGFLDPCFADAFAAYAGAFAARYRGIVTKITPLNEPYISTYFRAGWGIWPPHLKGRDGFATMLAPVVTGLRGAIRAIKTVAPETEIWLNDGADTFHPLRPELAAEGAFLTNQRYAAFDLLVGDAAARGATGGWLVEAGFPEALVDDEHVPVDVIGLDYYPETEHDFELAGDGTPILSIARTPLGLAATCRAYHERYGLPLFIAESSAPGDDANRRRWLDWNVAEMRSARAAGVDVVGYTWWPLFDHVDWNTLLVRRDGYVADVGLFHLRPTRDDRARTDAVDAFRAAVEAGI
ncbi:MAG: family 1 glycosylhydrolase [Trueperaceae bacterium]|nr:family 1 glycosylhydrolase [Trueperaceae bacterium]